MRPQYEVADIFRLYGEEYKKTHGMTDNQRKVMAAITACRTAQLGGNSEICDKCGTIRNSYNSCRNRHCPKCQTLAKEKWLEQRREELLPCGYFHMVFTVPHSLNPLILRNRRELLTILFKVVRNTIIAFAADPQWKLEGKPGLMTILHTWSQTLIDHFHIHCLIPAGVLSFDNRKWIASNENYLFGVESLAKEFKKQFLSLLHEQYAELVLPENSATLLADAQKKTWIVYAKKPFSDAEQVLEYLGRYTHRIAISNHRIREVQDGKVTFSYKDRSHDNQTKVMTLSGVEFIRRFLLHVLPFRFMKIRYYGFLANICKKKSVLLIRRLIGKDMSTPIKEQETTRNKLLRLTGKDIGLCPECKIGEMLFQRILMPVYDSG
ncbi:MAG: IS91 family transposase [Deltaproteobacteria bacterium]|nr:IS91 family transposase [Deltaproteobacteria bacterium]